MKKMIDELSGKAIGFVMLLFLIPMCLGFKDGKKTVEETK